MFCQSERKKNYKSTFVLGRSGMLVIPHNNDGAQKISDVWIPALSKEKKCYQIKNLQQKNSINHLTLKKTGNTFSLLFKYKRGRNSNIRNFLCIIIIVGNCYHKSSLGTARYHFFRKPNHSSYASTNFEWGLHECWDRMIQVTDCIIDITSVNSFCSFESKLKC